MLFVYSDFPGGEGESNFKGRGTVEDVVSAAGRHLLGFTKFDIPSKATEGALKVIKHANATLP